MKKRLVVLLSILMLILSPVRVCASGPAIPNRPSRVQSFRSEAALTNDQEDADGVNWPTVALFSLAGAGAGVITAVLLYKRCKQTE